MKPHLHGDRDYSSGSGQSDGPSLTGERAGVVDSLAPYKCTTVAPSKQHLPPKSTRKAAEQARKPTLAVKPAPALAAGARAKLSVVTKAMKLKGGAKASGIKLSPDLGKRSTANAAVPGEICLSLSELQSVYHLPSKEAADALGISLSHLKRSCRVHKVVRWPHRKLTSLENLQDTIRNDKNMKQGDKQRILEHVGKELSAVRGNPDHVIDPRLDDIRQAKYKLKYYHKTKHIQSAAAAAARKRRQQHRHTEKDGSRAPVSSRPSYNGGAGTASGSQWQNNSSAEMQVGTVGSGSWAGQSAAETLAVLSAEYQNSGDTSPHHTGHGNAWLAPTVAHKFAAQAAVRQHSGSGSEETGDNASGWTGGHSGHRTGNNISAFNRLQSMHSHSYLPNVDTDAQMDADDQDSDDRGQYHAHGVVDMTCPPPRCSSSGGTWHAAAAAAAATLARRASAPSGVSGDCSLGAALLTLSGSEESRAAMERQLLNNLQTSRSTNGNLQLQLAGVLAQEVNLRRYSSNGTESNNDVLMALRSASATASGSLGTLQLAPQDSIKRRSSTHSVGMSAAVNNSGGDERMDDMMDISAYGQTLAVQLPRQLLGSNLQHCANLVTLSSTGGRAVTTGNANGAQGVVEGVVRLNNGGYWKNSRTPSSVLDMLLAEQALHLW